MLEFDLAALGWSPELAENLPPGLVPGRVTAAHRAAFDVQTGYGSVRTRLPGRLVHEQLDVAVGDWVGLGDGLIREVLPRRSAIVRQAAGRTSESQTLAANVEHASRRARRGQRLVHKDRRHALDHHALLAGEQCDCAAPRDRRAIFEHGHRSHRNELVTVRHGSTLSAPAGPPRSTTASVPFL